MRWLLGILFFLGVTLFGGYVFFKGYPFRVYSNWIQGKEWNKYYRISGYKKAYLRPSEMELLAPHNEDYAQLWKNISIRNSQVPLPVRHPLFQTIPIVDSMGEKNAPQLGMIILSPNDRELSRLYTFPTRLFEDHILGQDLFQLPFLRNKLLRLQKDQFWKDLFSYKIEAKSKSLDEMIYDLYLLHVRSKILPSNFVRYGLLSNSKALIELSSKNKDYTIEVILSFDNNIIYSYMIRTEKNNRESSKLRNKFLQSISFNPIDPAMGNLIYTEFKQLNFARQVDQEGMLYLFSAWTQDLDNVEMFKEMIYYLERGRNQFKQLRPLYAFALKHYGKTFTTRKIFNDHEDQNVVLQRKIELENIERIEDAKKENVEVIPAPELTPNEKMNMYLKRAREEGSEQTNEMKIH